MDGFPGLSGLGYWMMRGLILVNQLITNIGLSRYCHKSNSADFRKDGIYGHNRSLTSGQPGNDTNRAGSWKTRRITAC